MKKFHGSVNAERKTKPISAADAVRRNLLKNGFAAAEQKTAENSVWNAEESLKNIKKKAWQRKMNGIFDIMNIAKNIFLGIILISVAAMIVLLFAGCSAEKYKIEYDNKSAFLFPKSSAKAGEKVTLIFKNKYIATDAGYTFFLNDETIDYTYSDKGMKMEFIMPEEDVKISYMINTAMSPYVQTGLDYTETADVLLIDYYEETYTEEGKEHYELVLWTTEDPLVLKLTEYIGTGGEETSKDHFVSCDAFDEFLHIIEVNEMRNWNDLKESENIDGIKIVVKFKTDEEEFRVSSEKMPENGMSVFAEIKRLLLELMG